tara:strand:+ start:27 stop:263 length:237 start_codon:yes stop_codon:yes gene_type:complete
MGHGNQKERKNNMKKKIRELQIKRKMIMFAKPTKAREKPLQNCTTELLRIEILLKKLNQGKNDKENSKKIDVYNQGRY